MKCVECDELATFVSMKNLRDYTNANRFDDWLVKVCRLNETGYLLPRWKRVWVFIRFGLLGWVR